MTYKQIGWLSWRPGSAHPESDKEFSTIALMPADKEAGYVEQPVYIDTAETPKTAKGVTFK